ncbi:MAG: nicotinate phosphoribosyltransferase [Desulfotomaculales bacterium]
MAGKKVTSVLDVAAYQVRPDRRLFSASHEEILNGWTADIYFVRTLDILGHLGHAGDEAAAEIFPSGPGIMCGTEEVRRLMQDLPVSIEALPEGERFSPREVVMRLRGPYGAYGIYETAILGILAQSSAWATAARECKEAAGEKKVLCFGARHVHPAVAPVMERAALVGGADGASCILGAKLAGKEPLGTIPHACFLIVGDTVAVARAYLEAMPGGAPVITLVDTFKDEAEETLRVANALREKLEGVRLDTPAERGGVTVDLVREVRARLHLAGYSHVKIVVSGGLDPDRIRQLAAAGADFFGVGSYISDARPIDMTMDLKEVRGRPVAKRGRIPGITPNPRLKVIKS